MDFEKIKNEIKNSENLDWSSKMEALFLLDEASRAVPMRKATEVIITLSDLYQEVTREDYKSALSDAIKKYKTEVRILSWDTRETPETVKDLLEALKIPTSEIPQEVLGLGVVVGMDDGMGYTPAGFQDVIDSYVDHENGVLRIWV